MGDIGDAWRELKEHRDKQKDRNYERRHAELCAAARTAGIRFHLRDSRTIARCWLLGDQSVKLDWWMRTGSARFINGPHVNAGTLQADNVGRISRLLREGPK